MYVFPDDRSLLDRVVLGGEKIWDGTHRARNVLHSILSIHRPPEAVNISWENIWVRSREDAFKKDQMHETREKLIGLGDKLTALSGSNIIYFTQRG